MKKSPQAVIHIHIDEDVSKARICSASPSKQEIVDLLKRTILAHMASSDRGNFSEGRFLDKKQKLMSVKTVVTRFISHQIEISAELSLYALGADSVPVFSFVDFLELSSSFYTGDKNKTFEGCFKETAIALGWWKCTPVEE